MLLLLIILNSKTNGQEAPGVGAGAPGGLGRDRDPQRRPDARPARLRARGARRCPRRDRGPCRYY